MREGQLLLFAPCELNLAHIHTLVMLFKKHHIKDYFKSWQQNHSSIFVEDELSHIYRSSLFC